MSLAAAGSAPLETLPEEELRRVVTVVVRRWADKASRGREGVELDADLWEEFEAWRDTQPSIALRRTLLFLASLRSNGRRHRKLTHEECDAMSGCTLLHILYCQVFYEHEPASLRQEPYFYDMQPCVMISLAKAVPSFNPWHDPEARRYSPAWDFGEGASTEEELDDFLGWLEASRPAHTFTIFVAASLFTPARLSRILGRCGSVTALSKRSKGLLCEMTPFRHPKKLELTVGRFMDYSLGKRDEMQADRLAGLQLLRRLARSIHLFPAPVSGELVINVRPWAEGIITSASVLLTSLRAGRNIRTITLVWPSELIGEATGDQLMEALERFAENDGVTRVEYWSRGRQRYVGRQEGEYHSVPIYAARKARAKRHEAAREGAFQLFAAAPWRLPMHSWTLRSRLEAFVGPEEPLKVYECS